MPTAWPASPWMSNLGFVGHTDYDAQRNTFQRETAGRRSDPAVPLVAAGFDRGGIEFRTR